MNRKSDYNNKTVIRINIFYALVEQLKFKILFIRHIIHKVYKHKQYFDQGFSIFC